MDPDPPFLRPDHCAYPEILTDAAVHVLVARGVDGFSVGALARRMNTTPQAVLNRYTRTRVLELVVIRFGQRWLDWSLGGEPLSLPLSLPRSLPLSLPLALPATEAERHGVLVWGVLHELARGEKLRGNPAPTEHLKQFRRAELDGLTDRLPAGAEVGGALATATGLRLALAESEPYLTYEQACAQLNACVDRVCGDESMQTGQWRRVSAT
jgi:AcrR family transcriptional regulator